MRAEPYVTKALLLKLFGPELASEVAARYFIEGQGPGGFRFRPEYYSEKVGQGSQHIGVYTAQAVAMYGASAPTSFGARRMCTLIL